MTLNVTNSFPLLSLCHHNFNARGHRVHIVHLIKVHIYMVYWQRHSVNLWCIGILHIHHNTYATEMCSLFFVIVFFPTQSVYAYTYPPTTPASVQESCTPGKISLLHAVDCLFYRYDKQEWIKYIWAIGLLAAGQSSTMTVSCGVYDAL